MTEAEWLECEVLEEMLVFIQPTERQLRLFICAAVRQVWTHLDHEASEKAVELAERYSDGGISEKLLESAAWAALCAADHSDLLPPTEHARSAARYAPLCHPEVAHALEASWYVAQVAPEDCSEKPQTKLLRDLIGNPFRPVPFDPSWLTSTVVTLAAGIYADRAFDRLPILADALQDAGCENPDVLAHCRGPGPHARGCWVVDLLLGKA